jgi:hypothetical protein
MNVIPLLASLILAASAQDKGAAKETGPRAVHERYLQKEYGDKAADKRRELMAKAKTLAEKDPHYADLPDAVKERVLDVTTERLIGLDQHNHAKGVGTKDKLDGLTIKFRSSEEELAAFYAKKPYLRPLKEDKIGLIEVVVDEDEDRDPPTVRVVEKPGDPKFILKTRDFTNLFEDNKTESCTKDALELSGLLADLAESLKDGGKITAIRIEGSASTLRNTGEAKEKSFERLATERAAAARDLVLKVLSENGISFPTEKVFVTGKGDNGDGTSGPRDPYGTGGRGDGGAPYSNLSDYAKHKYVRISIAGERDGAPPEKETVETPGAVRCSVVTVRFETESRRRWRLKQLFTWTRYLERRGGGRSPSRKNWGSTKCPKL